MAKRVFETDYVIGNEGAYIFVTDLGKDKFGVYMRSIKSGDKNLDSVLTSREKWEAFEAEMWDFFGQNPEQQFHSFGMIEDKFFPKDTRETTASRYT